MMRTLRFLKGLFALSIIALLGFEGAQLNREFRETAAWGVTVNDSTGKWRFHFYRKMTPKQIAKVFKDRMRVSEGEALRLAYHLLKVCQEYQFDPAVILSLIQAESSFRSRVVSSVGARGLMQLMPRTASYIARLEGLPYRNKVQLFDPAMNMTLGVAYLNYLREHYQNEFSYFLSAYNAGPGRVDKAIRTSRRERKKYEPRVTRPYIEKIRYGVKAWRDYGARDQKEDLRVIQRIINRVNKRFSFLTEARATEVKSKTDGSDS